MLLKNHVGPRLFVFLGVITPAILLGYLVPARDFPDFYMPFSIRAFFIHE